MGVCRGEGDIIVHRLDGDVSDKSPTFVLSDVPNLFDIFQKLTFDLAQVNLKGLAKKGLGRMMGAVVWDMPAGNSDEGPAIKRMDHSQEVIYYDSMGIKRTYLVSAASLSLFPPLRLSLPLPVSLVCVCVCVCV